jgi:hypothetical protein
VIITVFVGWSPVADDFKDESTEEIDIVEGMLASFWVVWQLFMI